MGSLAKVAVAAYIVLIGLGAQSSSTGDSNTLSPQTTESYEILSRTEMKHPASRKTVSGPWPRFAKEMLA